MISASMAGSRRDPVSAERTSARQSRIAHSGDAGDRLDELLPTLALGLENAAPRFGDRVVSAAALLGALDPASDDPAALLHAVEHRVERGDVEGEHAAGARFDQFRELISMPRLRIEEREDEKLGAALFELGGEHDSYMWE